MSFVNEIDGVVYILTVLSFFLYLYDVIIIFFRILPLSFYYTHYCKILLYYIIYFTVNTQFSLVAASFFTNKLSILVRRHYIFVFLQRFAKMANVFSRVSIFDICFENDHM